MCESKKASTCTMELTMHITIVCCWAASTHGHSGSITSAA